VKQCNRRFLRPECGRQTPAGQLLTGPMYASTADLLDSHDIYRPRIDLAECYGARDSQSISSPSRQSFSFHNRGVSSLSTIARPLNRQGHMVPVQRNARTERHHQKHLPRSRLSSILWPRPTHATLVSWQSSVRRPTALCYSCTCAVIHRCQPKCRSSQRKRGWGIQRKYQTLVYVYCL